MMEYEIFENLGYEKFGNLGKCMKMGIWEFSVLI
jgi:hypothetical protein